MYYLFPKSRKNVYLCNTETPRKILKSLLYLQLVQWWWLIVYIIIWYIKSKYVPLTNHEISKTSTERIVMKIMTHSFHYGSCTKKNDLLHRMVTWPQVVSLYVSAESKEDSVVFFTLWYRTERCISASTIREYRG